MNTEKKLYQWDTGQKLTGCTGLYVDFPIDNEVYRVETADGTCIIPDELLQTSGGHKVYECMTNNTIRSFAFSVTPRPKPPDYVFTPTERLTFEGLVQKVDDAVADMIRRAESGEFDGHTPVKGTDYFTTEEIQQIQNEVSSGAIGEFKSAVNTETNKFNANATEKVNTYNQNDSQKTTSYNANATEKLNAYNANANNRVAEFNAQTGQIQTDISELKSDLDNTDLTVNKIINKTPNLASESLIQQDKGISNNGSAAPISIYDSSIYDSILGIPVKAGVSYTLAPSRVWAVCNKEMIPYQFSSTEQTEPFEVVPTQSGYLCVSYYTQYRGRFYVNETAKNEWYTKPDEYLPNEWLLGVIENETSDVNELVKIMIRKSYNLIKKSQIQQNTALYTNGVGSDYKTYDNTRYDAIIGVKAIAGQTYYISPTRVLQIVNSSGTVLEQDINDYTSMIEYTPSHNGYFVLCYSISYRDSFFINKKEDGSTFEDYDSKYPEQWLLDVIQNNASSTLYGKTIYNFGDSCSEGGGTIDSKGPAELVADACGMICTDYAEGGASIVNYADVEGTSARGCVVTQMENAPSTIPDFILLAGGINDLKFTTPGTAPPQPTSATDYSESYINNLDITKFSGAFERAIYIALNKWTGSQLIYMFEHKMWSHFNDGTQEVHDIAIAICKKWNIPVLDMWEEGGLNLAVISQLKKYGSQLTGGGTTIDGVTYDGTHPDHEGVMAYYVPKLKAKLIECCPIEQYK